MPTKFSSMNILASQVGKKPKGNKVFVQYSLLNRRDGFHVRGSLSYTENSQRLNHSPEAS